MSKMQKIILILIMIVIVIIIIILRIYDYEKTRRKFGKKIHIY